MTTGLAATIWDPVSAVWNALLSSRTLHQTGGVSGNSHIVSLNGGMIEGEERAGNVIQSTEDLSPGNLSWAEKALAI